MAAITVINMSGKKRAALLETIAVTNAAATATVRKAVPVPPWARYARFVIGNLTLAGTSPLFDFALEGVDNIGEGASGAPDSDDVYALGGWDGITQKTAAAGTTTTIDVGPDLTNDDTGSATASDHYAVQAALPDIIVYKYTYDGTTMDEDYSGTIAVYFRA